MDLVIYGLIHDFNKTPIPISEMGEIEEEAEIMKEQVGIPDEILTGTPPKPKA